MPRTKVPRIDLQYGKSINNIKSTTLEILRAVFSTKFTLEKFSVIPTIIEFSVDADDPVRRRLEIYKRLRGEEQNLPCIVLSEFRGTFTTAQVGKGSSESWINRETGQKYLGYTCFCTLGTITLDLFAADPDTRDTLGDATVTGLLLALRDIDFFVSKTFSNGRYCITYMSEINRTPGADNPRDEDPIQRIVGETVEIQLNYEETVFVEAQPSNVMEDAIALGKDGLQYVGDLESNVGIWTNIPETLRIGKKFQAKVHGGSGFYQFLSTNLDILNIGPTGMVLPLGEGTGEIVVEDVVNTRTYTIPVSVQV